MAEAYGKFLKGEEELARGKIGEIVKLAEASRPSRDKILKLIQEVKASGLNKQRAREVFAEMVASGATAKQAIDKLGFKVVADEGQLLDIVRRAIAANPKAVADFKNGKTRAADAIKGAVMRETKGRADVIWRNKATGQHVGWLMDGLTVTMAAHML